MRVIALLVLLLLSGVGLAAAESTRTIGLSVPGMNCPVCPITVRKALQQVPGVQAVTVDYDTKVATVEVDPATVDLEALKAATANVGYPSELVSPGGR